MEFLLGERRSRYQVKQMVWAKGDPGSLLFSSGYLIIYPKQNSSDRTDFHLKIIRTLGEKVLSWENRREGPEPGFLMI